MRVAWWVLYYLGCGQRDVGEPRRRLERRVCRCLIAVPSGAGPSLCIKIYTPPLRPSRASSSIKSLTATFTATVHKTTSIVSQRAKETRPHPRYSTASSRWRPARCTCRSRQDRTGRHTRLRRRMKLPHTRLPRLKRLFHPCRLIQRHKLHFGFRLYCAGRLTRAGL